MRRSLPLQDFEIDFREALGIGHRFDRRNAVACNGDPQRDAQRAAQDDRDAYVAVDQRRVGHLCAALEGFDGERAALALTEALTRLSDRADPVPDDIREEAVKHYDESELAALLLAIANINVWNRLNVAVRQPMGAWKV